jgi:hypothetical protein
MTLSATGSESTPSHKREAADGAISRVVLVAQIRDDFRNQADRWCAHSAGVLGA